MTCAAGRVLLAGLAAVGLAALGSSRLSAAELQLSIAGPEELVFDFGRDACPAGEGEPRDIPDIPAAAFRRGDGQVVLLYGNRRNLYLAGDSLDTVARTGCDSLLQRGNDADPSRFADQEWLMAVQGLPDGGLAGFVHQEFHGDDHGLAACQERGTALFRCWYGAATLQLSADGGVSFQRQPLPQGLLAALPYPFSPAVDRAGLNSPKVVLNPRDGFLYVMVTSAATLGEQERGQCLLRGRSADAAAWRAWDGEAFAVRLESPYAADFQFDVCRPVLLLNVWSLKYLEKHEVFVALGQRGPTVAYAFSPDLVTWSAPQPLPGVRIYKPQARQAGDPDATLYYSLLDPGSVSPWYDTLADNPYLYFVRWRNAADGSSLPERDLLRVPLVIEPAS